MAELTIEIPEELEQEMKEVSEIAVSLAVTKLVKTELERLARLKKIVSKSELTEKDVEELSKKVDEASAKRFRESLK